MFRPKKAVSGWHIVDDKMIQTDSLMESRIIEYLVRNGFSQKWQRPRYGLAYGSFKYTPDVELCVSSDGMNRRALVEFKPMSASEFKFDRRRAMRVVSKHYNDAVCLLYVHRTRSWFIVEPNGALQPTPQPSPGGVPISELSSPRFVIPIFTLYGKSYRARPGIYALTKIVDSIDFLIKKPRSKYKRKT